METWTMSSAKTLMQLAGIDLTPPRLGDACLVLIDIQNEYLAGPLALPDASPAIARATALLGRARESGAKIIHIAHKGAPGWRRAGPRDLRDIRSGCRSTPGRHRRGAAG
jgi:nicotinamidase-related amidase